MQICPNCNVDVLNTPKSPSTSPIASLLTTNNPPEPREAAIAHQIITSSKTQTAQITRLIEKVYSILDGLKSRREEYERNTFLHQNVVRNIRRIPPDVLLEIFSHTIADGDPNDIWAVVEVCRRWREVAFSTPTLWSTFPIHKGTSAASILSRLSRSLRLSHSSPFKLSISYGVPYPICPLQGVASPHLKRVTHLTVGNFPRPNKSTFFAPSNPRLVQWTALRSLNLQFADTESPEASRITVFQHAPLLQDVDLDLTDRWRILFGIGNILLPWSQLRKFSASNVTLDGVFTVLRAASVLDECYLDFTETSMPSNIGSLSHQSLTTLHVTLRDKQVAYELFNRLTVPLLRKLSVDVPALDTAAVCDLIERSSCRLTFLSAPMAHFRESDDLSTPLRRLFSLLPDVTELCIPFSFASFKKVRARLVLSLPQLRHLSLKVTDPLEMAIPDLMALRCLVYANVPPLETIVFTSEKCHLYGLAPPSPHYGGPQAQSLQRWDHELGELSHFVKVGAVKDDTGLHRDLDRILSLISAESESGISGECLCLTEGQNVVSKLQELLGQLPVSLSLQRGRISAILALWLPRIKEYLASFGWIENSLAKTLVYTRRQGLLSVKVRDRKKDRFASFALQDGYLTLYANGDVFE
ncbi:hypothetical protein NLJ89_g5469 [Agrocybe chaxingu]|uniref:F-box domain-containing protein n=1 Tax=Agrocybe chaxingu TaxID=84603 RepID=A0A9W8JYG1_9AGAR|nr:hypothetical protein NLJ89_g5469 [Agrocybe chaxingu]